MAAGLRVLITNQALGSPTGTEVYVRDLARQLLARGHRPVVYSPNPGTTADELRRVTIPVASHLRQVTLAPDVIHGHHTHPTMTALAAFPDSPAVFFCHDWDAWHDAPLEHPRVRRHVAVDQTCYDRLVCLGGVSPQRAVHLPNWADIQRFRQRAPLPERPRRVLVFSNLAKIGGRRDVFRAACHPKGVEVEALGLAAGQSVAHPEERLGQYDLVFARGKCALEALATGNAVALYGFGRLGPLVTIDNLDELRALNFGRRAIQEPLTAEGIRRRLAQYDAHDAMNVAAHVRRVCDIHDVVDGLVDLYRQVIVEQGSAAADRHAETRAMSDYLSRTQMMVELGARRWQRKQREAELHAAGVPRWLSRFPFFGGRRRAA